MDSDKQIHVDLDTIVSFVIQSWQVSEGGAIFLSHHVNATLTRSCCCASMAVILAVTAAAATAAAVGMAPTSPGGAWGWSNTSGGVIAWGRKSYHIHLTNK